MEIEPLLHYGGEQHRMSRMLFCHIGGQVVIYTIKAYALYSEIGDR